MFTSFLHTTQSLSYPLYELRVMFLLTRLVSERLYTRLSHVSGYNFETKVLKTQDTNSIIKRYLDQYYITVIVVHFCWSISNWSGFWQIFRNVCAKPTYRYQNLRLYQNLKTQINCCYLSHLQFLLKGFQKTDWIENHHFSLENSILKGERETSVKA